MLYYEDNYEFGNENERELKGVGSYYVQYGQFTPNAAFINVTNFKEYEDKESE